jgi:hypothetical protein
MNRSNFNIWGPLMVKRGRGSGIVAADASLAMQQLAYGEVLVLKLLPQCPTDKVRFWPSATKAGAPPSESANYDNTRIPHWAQPSFNDSAWKFVSPLGPVEPNRNLLQCSADAGTYAWPGYKGVFPSLGTYDVLPVAATHRFTGRATFHRPQSPGSIDVKR